MKYGIDYMMDAIDAELEDFQWAYPDRGENRGEIHVNREEKKLHLVIWCRDNDDPGDESVHPLDVSKDITLDDARDQIRAIIHDYLCHEADEQIWFGNERPYYPHEE